MSLKLNERILQAAYFYLRSTPPFRRWGLPAPSDVKFGVTRHKDREGDYELYNGQHVIRVSNELIGHTDSLMCVMGHEMIHLYQKMRGVRSHHNKEFHRLAKLACKRHGWDPFLFIGVK